MFAFIDDTANSSFNNSVYLTFVTLHESFYEVGFGYNMLVLHFFSEIISIPPHRF